MEDIYKKETDYVVELHLIHENETRSADAIEFFSDMAGEVMAFETEAEAYVHALANKYGLDLIAERSPLVKNLMTGSPVRSRLLKFRILRRETSYVCASADGFWDEVDQEVSLEREVLCGDS